MFARLIFILFLLGYSAQGGAYAETPNTAADEAALQALVPDIVAKFSVSKDGAIRYLHLSLDAVNARKAAKGDKSSVSNLYADMLEKLAEVILFQTIAVEQGHSLLEELNGGTPGTPLPAALAEKVHNWAGFAATVAIDSAKLTEIASKWAEQRVLQAPECQIEGTTFNISACGKITEESVSIYGKLVDQMRASGESLSVIVLFVSSRLVY